MGRLLTGKELNLVLRMLLGITFVYAALDKIANPHAFAISVRAYQIVPVSLSNLFALVMPWAEVIAGGLLILGLMTRKAAAAVFMLLVAFTAAIAAVMVRGMVVDCGCFGSDGGSSTGWLLILRNVGLLAAAFLVMRCNDGFAGVDGMRRPSRQPLREAG